MAGYEQKDWQGHYDAGDLRWDLGVASPPIIKLWEDKEILPGNTIIPGCGRGHEALFLMEKGFRVAGVDYSPGAIDYLSQEISNRNLLGCALLENFFKLNDDHNAQYDLMIEQTFFCAISPQHRPLYVETAYRLLKDNGILAGVFYETGAEDGPPFNTTREDILQNFEPFFKIKRLEKTLHSAESRKGKEWLGILEKRSKI